MTKFIRIDNQIIERIGNTGFKVGPIKLFEKQNKIKLDLNKIPYVSSGSRLSDSLIMQNLVNGNIKYEKLNITYPDRPLIMKEKTYIRIDNQIIERIGNNGYGFKVGPIKLFEKQNKIKLDLNKVPYVSSGSRLSDSLIIQDLFDGNIKYEDLSIIYPIC